MVSPIPVVRILMIQKAAVTAGTFVPTYLPAVGAPGHAGVSVPARALPVGELRIGPVTVLPSPAGAVAGRYLLFA